MRLDKILLTAAAAMLLPGVVSRQTAIAADGPKKEAAPPDADIRVPDRPLKFVIEQKPGPGPVAKYEVTFEVLNAVTGSDYPSNRAGVRVYKLHLAYLGAFLRNRSRDPWEQFKAALNDMREDRRLPDVVAKFLTSEVPQLEIRYAQPESPRSQPRIRAFALKVATPQEAEQLVRGLIQFCDYGIVLPLRKALAGDRQRLQDEVAALRTKMEGAKTELADAEKALSRMEKIDVETLRDLKKQERTVAVNAASAAARIEACNRLLEEAKSNAARRSANLDTIETLRSTAEIELVGLAASRRYLEGLIQTAERSVKLQEQIADLGARIPKIKGSADRDEAQIKAIEETQTKFHFWQIKDNLVTLTPIAWLPPQGDAASGGAAGQKDAGK